MKYENYLLNLQKIIPLCMKTYNLKKNMKNNYRIILSFMILFSLFSCSTKKDILYLQNLDEYNNSKVFITNNSIQAGDILNIKVSTLSSEASIPFNSFSGSIGQVNDIQSMKINGYLVSDSKTINFPVLGEISVSKKTIKELELDLRKALKSGGYLTDPLVTIRLLNAKFTVLGEVKAPGTYETTEVRISLLEALGMAGGLNINADRKNLVILREIDDRINTTHIDLSLADWLNGPYSHIHPNDILLINPNKAKVISAGIIKSPSDVLSIFSVILSTVILLISI
ncbi:MAG: polysaccharide export outer membrane protein [Flavobacteriaceae bacterium]|jgi:polysaccharide export outer membrane protein